MKKIFEFIPFSPICHYLLSLLTRVKRYRGWKKKKRYRGDPRLLMVSAYLLALPPLQIFYQRLSFIYLLF